MSAWEDNEEIKLFREYLRIPSVHPDIDYEPCITFLQKQADDLGLPLKVYYPADKTKPVAIITWVGTQPNLPSVVLNSHMDVVPVFEDKWTHPPFGAEMDSEGRIFARGSQDMKCVGMQYLAAIRALKKRGTTMKRTVHITFVADEEIGGHLGMEAFVKTDDFKKLNVGFSLDEGVAATDDTYLVYYAERSIWQIHFQITGTAGHGSLLLKNTVGEKFHYILNKMMAFRANESKRLESDASLSIGDVTTVNLTTLKGGVQSNVVPPFMDVCFDIRLAITVDHGDFEKQVRQWCLEAGGDIELYFEQKEPKIQATKTDDSNIYWKAFENCLVNDLGLKIVKQVFPGGTDSRHLRYVGVPAIGFSPMINTPVLLHDHDEFLKADTYLRGIEIYEKLIPAVVNV
ncbi:aminoacylase-1 isoform X1 [Stomoxys calcitrans]|uniref:N-acyl-aliphatic-L-amino acid amidohydrolase n=1 Tax=Stomoxys calcitrans TaxID=35570 RepID=A0A1I8NQY9_STOCA|nr:aminoacylase-1 isoform X1 [Stomoxys calcitrans]XP_013107893.1 aminoacylase-1 isoform X1 [Stomoxys calcitrans]XP_013107894.1 aminoacylase-1 isoform X1 [Stomoxys calcitrans]XP_059223910.1 aminoacylase-1 isoform X1 [Stomoxys calcitrans]